MFHHNTLFAAAAVSALAVAGIGSAGAIDHHMEDEGKTAKKAAATLMDANGNEAGTASFTQTPNGVLIKGELILPAGTHGFHIHETGACTPDFAAAGGHYAPLGNDHGALVEDGLHAGDMPNIHVGEDGMLTVEVLNAGISLEEGEAGYLFDEDGSALMIHAGADDYESQPSGAAGDRIACGVIEME